jgi:hypothetical protein
MIHISFVLQLFLNKQMITYQLLISIVHPTLYTRCVKKSRILQMIVFRIVQALHASWEPRHSRYCHKFPSQQYVKVGIVLRQFGYTVVALHGCLRTEIQVT